MPVFSIEKNLLNKRPNSWISPHSCSNRVEFLHSYTYANIYYSCYYSLSHDYYDIFAEDFNYALGNELYFFTTRERKYFNGSRPSRTAGDGFWKATSVEQVIKGVDESSIIGYKKKLVFYYKEDYQKTDWQMHEYRIEKTDGSAGKESMKVRNQ